MEQGEKITRESLKKLGFVEVPHFTIGKVMTFKMGGRRVLSISDVGTPNEMMFIGQLTRHEDRYDDLVRVHNYDFDGYMTQERMEALLKGLNLQTEVR
jgi:hypothetical protein